MGGIARGFARRVGLGGRVRGSAEDRIIFDAQRTVAHATRAADLLTSRVDLNTQEGISQLRADRDQLRSRGGFSSLVSQLNDRISAAQNAQRQASSGQLFRTAGGAIGEELEATRNRNTLLGN